jgi:Rps23 Pro-64 3,4-dihydroxylase Tpa1-like proline 4-hydroxylase
MFQYIDFDRLKARQAQLKKEFQSKTPFRYLSFENFFFADKAELILQNYPSVEAGIWDGTTYINQKNKFQKREFETGSIFNDVFDELNSVGFLNWLSEITEIPKLLPDEKLFGGGLHQSVNGAFLDVHVDYNIHPETKLHRRLNALVYMNKDWQDDYEGHLELWDMGEKKMLDKIAPVFNRCVVFETNEISFHGHPKPLKTPEGVSRKSLATYYYTVERPIHEIAPEHNTIYVNTEGLQGTMKNLQSGVKAFLERVNKK